MSARDMDVSARRERAANATTRSTRKNSKRQRMQKNSKRQRMQPEHVEYLQRKLAGGRYDEASEAVDGAPARAVQRFEKGDEKGERFAGAWRGVRMKMNGGRDG